MSATPGVDAAEVLCTLSGSTALGFIYGDVLDGGALDDAGVRRPVKAHVESVLLAERDGPIDQGVLAGSRFLVVRDLLGCRLTNVDDGPAVQVPGFEFG